MSVAAQLARQISRKARRVDELVPRVKQRFLAKEPTAHSKFSKILSSWAYRRGNPISTNEAMAKPVSESLQRIMGMAAVDGAGGVGSEAGAGAEESSVDTIAVDDLQLGFEVNRELSNHIVALEIASEWAELLRQCDRDELQVETSVVAAESSRPPRVEGVERGAMLIDRIGKYLDEDELAEFGPEYQVQTDDGASSGRADGVDSKSLHALDAATLSKISEITERIRKCVDEGRYNRDDGKIGGALVEQEEKLTPESEPGPPELTPATPPEILQIMNEVLFEDLGFRGNTVDGNNPRQSYLSNVLEERTGVPISMSILYTVLASNLGLQVHGLSLFPSKNFLLSINFAPEAKVSEKVELADSKEPQPDPAVERMQETAAAATLAEDDSLADEKQPSEGAVEARFPLQKGDEIEVYWNGDDKWYPAEITIVRGDVLMVEYWDNDDRHRQLCTRDFNKMPDLHDRVLAFRKLKDRAQPQDELFVGRRVEVWWNGDNAWYPATVKQVTDDNVRVQYDDMDGRNTTIPMDLFGAAPDRDSKGRHVFRLFQRPYTTPKDATSCIINVYDNGKILSNAECSRMLSDVPRQSLSQLQPAGRVDMWVGLLRMLMAMSQASGSERAAELWQQQLIDITTLRTTLADAETREAEHAAVAGAVG